VTRAKRKNPNRAGTDARKRKDGRYETRATPNTPTGRRRVSFYGATAEEANNKKFQALADQAKGILFSDPGRLTVVEYLQRWLTDTARFQVSEGTLERYERTCRNHLVPFFGRLRLRDLTAAHVRAFKARKIEEGLNPNTVGVMQGVLSTALNQAVDDDLIPSNFASRVKKAATRGRSPMRSLSQEEASRLLRAADGTRDEALMTLALRTGMRQGELAALRWEDVDLAGKPSINVRRSADTRTKTRVSTTKSSKERKIRIDPRTVEVLKAHRAGQLKERIAATSWADPGLVFPNTKGKIRRRDSVMRSLRRFLGEAGLPVGVRFHDLRHTAGTLALRQGIPLHAVSRMLGHSDPAMTLRRYAHVLEDMREDAARAMDELFWPQFLPQPTPTSPDLVRLSPASTQPNLARIRPIRTPTGARIRIRLLRAESGLRDGPDPHSSSLPHEPSGALFRAASGTTNSHMCCPGCSILRRQRLAPG
jgi:integrase